MKPLFGEFLLSKKLVTEEVLSQALLEQSKGLPSIPDLLYSCHLLEPRDLLAIFRHQVEFRKEFIQSAKDLGIWRSEFEATLQSELAKRRTPLGQLLLEKGILTPTSLVEALDAFLNETRSEPNTAPRSPQSPLEPHARAELESLLTPELMTKLSALTGASGEQSRSELLRALRSIRGRAHFAADHAVEKASAQVIRAVQALSPTDPLSSIEPLFEQLFLTTAGEAA